MHDPSATLAAPAVPMPRTKSALWERFLQSPWRPVKALLAGGTLAAGVFGVFSENTYVSTSDAIVSAYVLPVRTPVEGTVRGLPITSGLMVQRGQSLGQVDNALVDPAHFDTLRTEENGAEATMRAIEHEQVVLSRQRSQMIARSELHMSAVRDRLQQELAEAEETLRTREVTEVEAHKEATRGLSLHELGVVAQADLDKLVSAEDVATRERAAEQREVESVRLQYASAVRGILIEPGTNSDVPYSRQRADELAIKMADNERMLASSRLVAEQAQAAAQVELERTERLRHASLDAPMDALVWKLNAVNGEHAAAGDTVVSLVDCKRQFILAQISQNRLPDVALHQRATYRLTGETTDRSGIVLSASGDPLRQDETSLAALPGSTAEKKTALVLIGIDTPESDASGCLVGREVRVLIPTAPTNSAVRWFRSYF